MADQYTIDPENELKERNRTFFSRVFGAVAGAASALATGYHLVEKSLDNWIDIQLKNKDWYVTNAYNEIRSGKKTVFHARTKKPTKGKEDAILTHEIKRPGYLNRAEERFNKIAAETRKSRDERLRNLEENEGPIVKQKEANLRAEYESKFREIESTMSGDALKEKKHRLQESYRKDLDAISKDFRTEIEKITTRCDHIIALEEQQIFKPAIYKFMKSADMLGLGYRHADNKTQIRTIAFAVGAVTTIIATIEASRFLHRHEKKSHTELLATQREQAKALSMQPSAARP